MYWLWLMIVYSNCLHFRITLTMGVKEEYIAFNLQMEWGKDDAYK